MDQKKSMPPSLPLDTQFIINSSFDGILAYDRDFRYTLWNPAMEQISGLKKEEVLDQKAFEIFPFLLEIGEDVLMKRVLEGESCVRKDRPYSIPSNGKKGYFEGRYSPLKDASGQIIGGLGIVREVTDWKIALETLQKVQEEERLILDSMPAMIWYKDRSNRILRANKKAAAAKGVSVEQMEGRATSDFYPEEAAQYHIDDLEVINSGQPKIGIIEQHQVADGRKVWVKTDKIPYRAQNGDIIGVIVCAEDITEIKKPEEVLKEINADLARSNQIKSQFISVLSHELRTPINSIKESIQITLDGLDGPLTNEQRETLTISKNNIGRLERLIRNVLDFATLDAGKVFIVPAKVNLNELTKEVVHLMRPLAQKKDLPLDLDVPSIPLITSCDPDKIKQVAMNIIDNAIKYTDAGGFITVKIFQDHHGIHLHFKDTGMGIRPADQEKIFEMYAQVHDKRIKRAGGVGIGLALCKQIIELHHGTLSVESHEGQGSCFMVTLPLTGFNGVS